MRKLARNLVATFLMIGSCGGAAAVAQSHSVVNSPHNLSASGPGTITATGEQQVCIFCHTPHNASPVQPLWNRLVPANAYIPYSSTSLQAQPGQPTGSSKLCLSCHDGTIALGSVLSRNQPIAMANGMTTLPPGHRANLGTDLSDDHPISFRYDGALVAKDPKLRDPNQLPPSVRLDAQQELQCTTCHDPHDNRNGGFLVMDNGNSQLCRTCHNQPATEVAAHVQCASCHQPHTAPSGAQLLRGVTVRDACARCHGGQVGPDNGPNILADLAKISSHDAPSTADRSRTMAAGQVNCNDCHESHSMGTGTAAAPLIPPNFGAVSGVNASGAAVPRAQYEYEVCFKCHSGGPGNADRVTVTRQITQQDTRLEFAPSAVSYHPVQVPGRSTDVPSLVPGMTTASMLYCTDCHASDTGPAAGGTGAAGPHGSNVSPLLSATYDTFDNTTESATAYALCYKCHERNSILGNESFSGHSKHVVDARTPCSVCHDPHGIPAGQGNATNNSRLMNFDTRIVRPDPVTGRLEFRAAGPRSGSCYLSCHGVSHSPKSYPLDTGGGTTLQLPVSPAPLPSSPMIGPLQPARGVTP